MVYDSVRQQVILFGGRSGTTSLNDTWIWDGVDWTQKFPANSPSPRIQGFFAFDTIRGYAVLYGGTENNNSTVGDTWIWDGTDWSQQLFAISPGTRTTGGIAFDSQKAQVVLYGGFQSDATGNLLHNDTWVLGASN